MGPLGPLVSPALMTVLANWSATAAAIDGWADPNPEPSASAAAPPSQTTGARPAASTPLPAASAPLAGTVPPARPDDIMARFAPSRPVAQSLLGLRPPETEAERRPTTSPRPAGDAASDAGPAGTAAKPDETVARIPPAGPPGAVPDAPRRSDGVLDRQAVAAPSRAPDGGPSGEGSTSDAAFVERPVAPSAPAAGPAPAAGVDRGAEPAWRDEAASGLRVDVGASAGAGAARRDDASTGLRPDAGAGAAPPASGPGEGASPGEAASALARRHEAVPGGTAPVHATAAQSSSVPALAPETRPAASLGTARERDRDGRAGAEAPTPASPDTRVAVPADAPVARRDAAAAADGWTQAAEWLSQLVPEGQAERGGILPAFILNAAMIPGWPPPRPFDMPEAGAVLEKLAGAATERDLLALLSERGAEAGLLARMRERYGSSPLSRRLRVLLGLAALWTTIDALLDAIEEELLRLSERQGRAASDPEQDEVGLRQALTA